MPRGKAVLRSGARLGDRIYVTGVLGGSAAALEQLRNRKARLKDYEVEPDALAKELAKRYQTARSWWDVGDLFPIMFVDFDRREVGAFYSQGVAMERYVPDGWTGRFIDFATEYPEEVFPTSSKFWVKGGVDLLALLNKRGAEGGSN